MFHFPGFYSNLVDLIRKMFPGDENLKQFLTPQLDRIRMNNKNPA